MCACVDVARLVYCETLYWREQVMVNELALRALTWLWYAKLNTIDVPIKTPTRETLMLYGHITAHHSLSSRNEIR